MSYEQLLYEKRGRVTYITLNRPQSLNALSTTLLREVNEAFLTYHEDDQAWIAVLRGAGDRAFCAGADLKEMAAGGFSARPSGPPIPGFFWGTLPLVKPVIGAIHGYALGGGFELALACDILIASEDARFGLTEVLRGINPGPGIHLIMRKLPYNVALEHLMTGAQMTAAQAHHYGLVNQVVPRDQLDAAVEAMVERLLAAAPLAVQAVKTTALRGLGAPLATALALSVPHWIGATEDAKEGPRAFAEKRKPSWQGK